MMLPFRSTPWKHQRQGTLHGSADPHQVVAMDTPATIAVPRRFSTQRSPTSMGGNRWNMWLHLLYIYIYRLPAPGPASHHEIVNKSYQRTLPCFVSSWSKNDEFFASSKFSAPNFGLWRTVATHLEMAVSHTVLLPCIKVLTAQAMGINIMCS